MFTKKFPRATSIYTNPYSKLVAILTIFYQNRLIYKELFKTPCISDQICTKTHQLTAPYFHSFLW